MLDEAGGANAAAWRKILYEQQSFPDNYTDQRSYLASVLTNVNQVPLSFQRLVMDSAVVTRQVSAVAIFCVFFIHTYYRRLSAGTLIALELLLLLAGWRGQRWVLRRDTWREALSRLDTAFLSEARQLTLLVGWLLSLSPLLGTLTRTWSDDTITALVISLFLLHLGAHDYAYASNYTNRFRGTISLNAAVFASVLLAARLPSTPLVFAVMALAVQMFVLLPAQWRLLAGSLSGTQHAVATGLLVGLAAAMLLAFSRLLVVAYLAAILVISLLCPWLLVHLQHQKADISGPWDAAIRAFLLAPTDLDPQ
jgi:phosphatidylinositol N-acetylglucosaminyltransferase subunit C